MKAKTNRNMKLMIACDIVRFCKIGDLIDRGKMTPYGRKTGALLVDCVQLR